MSIDSRPFETGKTVDKSRLTERMREWVDHPSWDLPDDASDESTCRRLLSAACVRQASRASDEDSGKATPEDISQAESAPPRFRVAEKIGHGGFGIGFRVVDSQLDREAAVKILRPSLVSQTKMLRRFLREARAIQSLSHSGIIEIYDVGEVA